VWEGRRRVHALCYQRNGRFAAGLLSVRELLHEQTMTSRERFAAAMARRAVDRVPIDLGATSLTGISAGCQERLCDYLGIRGEAQPSNSGVDERILLWAGTDFRSVGGIVPLAGPLARVVSERENVDCWGVRRRLVGGYWEIVESPLEGATVEDLRAFPWPSPAVDGRLLDRWREDAKRLRGEGRFVVVGEHPVFGILELGCWMCGYGDFLARIAADADFVRAFFDRYFAIQMEVVEQYYSALAGYLDLTMSGDDFGMQTGPLISPSAFRALVAPYFAERIKRTKTLACCLYWHHTCGSVVALLDDIIACGVDILNPIQTSAAGMNPADLKSRYGDRIAFWGAVDVQDLMRTADPGTVTREVTRLVRALGDGGGYVLAPAHNIQDDVPAENVVAMVNSARANGA